MRAGPNQRQQPIMGALHARTGQVEYWEHALVGREHIITFSGRLNHRFAQARRIYVIQDTWSIHQHPDVVTALARLPRLEPVWLSTSAPG